MCSLPSLKGFSCAGLMEGLSTEAPITQNLLHLEASNCACLSKNEFCMLSISVNIWDALILSQHFVEDKPQQTKQSNHLNML